MAGEEGDVESLDRILDENAVFSQDTISPELLNVITVITQTAIREAMGARDPGRAEGSNRRLTLLNSRASNPDIVYMRSDQQDLPDKMNAIREGNAQDLILLVRTQQRNGHKARQLSKAMLNSVADYHARAELAALDAPPSPPVATPAEEEDEGP